MTKTVEVEPLEILAAYMVEVSAPTLSATLNRLRIAFNIATPWKGGYLRAKKTQALSAKAALKQDPLCAQTLERPRKERLQARARMPKGQWCSFSCL
jgi:hypothetical protein